MRTRDLGSLAALVLAFTNILSTACPIDKGVMTDVTAGLYGGDKLCRAVRRIRIGRSHGHLPTQGPSHLRTVTQSNTKRLKART